MGATIMAALSSFLPRLLPMVPGCPDPTAEMALLDSAISFCEESNVLQEYLDPTLLVEGQHQYDIDLPAGTVCARVLRAWVGRRLLPTVGHIGASSLALFDGGGTGAPVTSVVIEEGVLNVTPVPGAEAAGQELRVQVALKPSRTAATVDDALLAHWADPIVMGALSRLALTPGVMYTSAELAAVGRAEFLRGVSAAKRERYYGRVVASARVRGRPLSGS